MNPSAIITPLQLIASGLLKNSTSETVDRMRTLAADAKRGDSYVERTRSTRVEPLALIDNTIQHLPIMTDVMQSLTTQMAAMYIQTLATITKVGDIAVVEQLDRLSPDRGNSAQVKFIGSFESMALPIYGKDHKISAEKLACTIEVASMEALPAAVEKTKDGKEITKPDVTVGKIDEVVKEVPNLLVGKVVDVTIQNDGHKLTVPITFKIIPMSASPRIVSAILAMGSVNNSVKERWHSFRAGQLDFFADFIFMNDLLKEHRKLLKDDNTGFYRETLRRRRNNTAEAFASAKASAGTSSNILVISKATAAEIERKYGLSISNHASREKMIGPTSAMLLAVVDPDYEVVKFYYKSIPLPTELTFRDLKASNKKTGPDVTEILAAFNQMKAPTF